MSSYDPAALVCKAGVSERYRFGLQGLLEEDEGMRCAICGFASRLPGTPVFAWRRVMSEVEPPMLELCEICNAAAHGPSASPERV